MHRLSESRDLAFFPISEESGKRFECVQARRAHHLSLMPVHSRVSTRYETWEESVSPARCSRFSSETTRTSLSSR